MRLPACTLDVQLLVGVALSTENVRSPPFNLPSPLPVPRPQRLNPKTWHTALIALSVFCVKISPKPAPLSWAVNLPLNRSTLNLINIGGFPPPPYTINMGWLMLQWEHMLYHYNPDMSRFFFAGCHHSLFSAVASLNDLITRRSARIHLYKRWCFKATVPDNLCKCVVCMGANVVVTYEPLNTLQSARPNAWVFSVVVLTGISTAEEPGMVGSGRVPGMEAGRGCLCLFLRCSSEDREPGTGLWRNTQRDL